MRLSDLLDILDKANITVVRKYDNWVTVKCPLSYKFHLDGNDIHPSAGISYGDSVSVFNCFACGKRLFISVLMSLYWDDFVDMNIIIDCLSRENIDDYEEDIEVKELILSKKYLSKDRFYPVPSIILSQFKCAGQSKLAQNYFTQRGIDLKFLNDCFVWQGKFLVFPIRDIDGKIYNLHCRLIGGRNFFYLTKERFKTKLDWGNPKLWYNLENIDWAKPVILVEGEFDVLRLRTLGIDNVIASCGSISKAQLEYLKSFSPVELWLVFDNDVRGQNYTNKVIDFFKKYGNIKLCVLKLSILGIKDPGEIGSLEDFYKLIENLKEV